MLPHVRDAQKCVPPQLRVRSHACHRAAGDFFGMTVSLLVLYSVIYIGTRATLARFGRIEAEKREFLARYPSRNR